MAEPGEVSLTTRQGHGCTVVQVDGVLDLGTAPALRAHLTQTMENGVVVVLDLAGVDFIDSSALGAIVSVYKELRHRAGRLCLATVQPSVRRVFELTSVDRLVSIYDSVESAEEDLATAGGED